MTSDHDNTPPTGVDLEILARDIQAINSSDAVVAFFARLGFNTSARPKTSPASLGIAAEGTIRPIKRVELLAATMAYCVYLFELTSVTVTHPRALARSFKNRAGDQLLVLTSDYDTLDFVLLERYLPADEASPTPMTQKQASRRLRVLTVNRRNPTTVQIRVLRRFTWTGLWLLLKVLARARMVDTCPRSAGSSVSSCRCIIRNTNRRTCPAVFRAEGAHRDSNAERAER